MDNSSGIWIDGETRTRLGNNPTSTDQFESKLEYNNTLIAILTRANYNYYFVFFIKRPTVIEVYRINTELVH